jgi:hypothetical protein
VSLLLNLHYDVSLKHVRDLLALPLVENLLVVCHALYDVKCEGLCLHFDLFTFTFSTVFVIHTALSLAFWAVLLHLHFHEAHVLNHCHGALTFTLGASFSFTTFGAATFASSAVDVSLDVEFFLDAVVKLLKGHLEIKLVLWALSALVSASKAHKKVVRHY